MQYKRCKCGKCERWDTGEHVHDCQGCDQCQTTFSGGPEGHKELQPHVFDRVLFNQQTGRPYRMCSRCNTIDKESYTLSKEPVPE